MLAVLLTLYPEMLMFPGSIRSVMDRLLGFVRGSGPADPVRGLDEEVRFLPKWLESGGLEWPQDYRDRFDPSRPLPPHFAGYVNQLAAAPKRAPRIRDRAQTNYRRRAFPGSSAANATRPPPRYVCLAFGRMIYRFTQQENVLTLGPWLPIFLLMVLLGGLQVAAARGSGLETFIYRVF